MKTIVFFNNKGGVGKTSLVYHLSFMYAELGRNVVAVDLDPQANLTAMFLGEDRLEQLWPDNEHPDTILGAIDPIRRGIGDVKEASIEHIDDHIGLVVGDLGLSLFESDLSLAWPYAADGKENAFRTLSAFYRIIQGAAKSCEAEFALIDVGPNLGAINRAALIAADYVVVPMAADLFSLQGLKNLGPTLRSWKQEWKDRTTRKPQGINFPLPNASIQPLGYVILQHAVRSDRPVKAYDRWMKRIPEVFRRNVLEEPTSKKVEVQSDPYCLAMLKNYRSLMPLAQEASKPMFSLKAADGAQGGHYAAAQECFKDFRALALKIESKVAN